MLVDIAEEVRLVDAPSGSPVKVVAVDGHGGAGKSTLALELSEMLGAEIIHTDDFAYRRALSIGGHGLLKRRWSRLVAVPPASALCEVGGVLSTCPSR